MGRPVTAAALAGLDQAGQLHKDAHDTETLAAGAMRPHTKRLRELVLELLRGRPDGLTDDDGAQLLRAKVPSADRLTFGRRRQELVTAGLVRDSGHRRPTPHGRSAIVWQAVR